MRSLQMRVLISETQILYFVALTGGGSLRTTGLRTTEYTQISGGRFLATMGNPMVLDPDNGIYFVFWSTDKPMLATMRNPSILVGGWLVLRISYEVLLLKKDGHRIRPKGVRI